MRDLHNRWRVSSPPILEWCFNEKLVGEAATRLLPALTYLLPRPFETQTALSIFFFFFYYGIWDTEVKMEEVAVNTV